jgi:hypothetical protein
MKSRHFGSYDRPLIRAYTLPQVNFGGDANVVHLLPVPKLKGAGLRGRVLSAEITRITEDFTGDVSDAGVRVDDGVTAGKYFNSGLVLTEADDIGEVRELEDTGAAVEIEAGRSNITVTAVAGTTTETGIADLTIVVAWW